MKQTIKLMMVAVIATLMMSACTRINPGFTGFKVNYSGDYRGVDSLPQETGWVWFMPGFSTVVEFPTSMQHKVWTESTDEGSETDEAFIIGCKGGAGFKLDIGINYRIEANKAAHIYFKFKANDMEDLHNGYLRTIVRQVVNDLSGTYTVDSLLSYRTVFEKIAEHNLATKLNTDGFIDIQLSILKTPTPTDKALADAINAKIKAKQDAERTQTELQTSVAQANKDIAKAKGDSASTVIHALGVAVANQKLQQSLTPMLLQKMYYDTWDGHLPTYMLGNNTTMMMQIPVK